MGRLLEVERPWRGSFDQGISFGSHFPYDPLSLFSKPLDRRNRRFRSREIRHALKIAVVSNEGRELNAYRIRKLKLDKVVDTFVSSCFVHLRKPDADMFRLALDIVQAPARQVAYIENTPMFVQVAEGLGIPGILHTDYASTCAKLASFGLQSDARSDP